MWCYQKLRPKLHMVRKLLSKSGRIPLVVKHEVWDKSFGTICSQGYVVVEAHVWPHTLRKLLSRWWDLDLMGDDFMI
jgi:hypothetical protein